MDKPKTKRQLLDLYPAYVPAAPPEEKPGGSGPGKATTHALDLLTHIRKRRREDEELVLLATLLELGG